MRGAIDARGRAVLGGVVDDDVLDPPTEGLGGAWVPHAGAGRQVGLPCARGGAGWARWGWQGRWGGGFAAGPVLGGFWWLLAGGGCLARVFGGPCGKLRLGLGQVVSSGVRKGCGGCKGGTRRWGVRGCVWSIMFSERGWGSRVSGGGAQEKGYLRANTPDRGGATTKRELRPHRTCTRNFRAARHLQKKLVLGKDRRVGWEMPIPGDRKCGPELKNRNFSEYSYT